MLHKFIDDYPRFRLWCGTCGWLVYQLSTTCLWESWPHVELYQSFRAVPQHERWREAGIGWRVDIGWTMSTFILFHLEGIPILGAQLAWNLGHFSGVLLNSLDLKLGSWCQETARWFMDILVRGQSDDHQSGKIPINVIMLPEHIHFSHEGLPLEPFKHDSPIGFRQIP